MEVISFCFTFEASNHNLNNNKMKILRRKIERDFIELEIEHTYFFVFKKRVVYRKLNDQIFAYKPENNYRVLDIHEFSKISQMYSIVYYFEFDEV